MIKDASVKKLLINVCVDSGMEGMAANLRNCRRKDLQLHDECRYVIVADIV